MSVTRLRLLALLTLVVGGLTAVPIALAASATVAVARHAGDRSALTLSGARRRALSREHVSIGVTRPATHSGSNVSFPQTSGGWNFSTATGTLSYTGIARLRDGKRSAPLRRLSFTRTAKGKSSVTATSSTHRFTLFNLTGRARIQRQGSRETISGLTAHLTAQAARVLNADLRHKVVTKNENMGAFTITVTNTSGTGTSHNGASAASASPSSPGVQLVVTHALYDTLSQSGLAPTPFAPASGGLPAPAGTTTVPDADGTAITLPAASGSSATAGFNDGTLTGTIPLDGGIQLGSGTGSATLSNPELTLGTGTEGSSLSFSVNGGPQVKLFDIDTSDLEKSTTSNGDLSLSGLTATLSSQGASTINQLAGKQIVHPQETVGGLTVIVPSSSTGS